MTGATSERGKMKKLTRSRPTCPSWGSATSITVSPMEMSKWPASSNSVQGGLASSRGRSLVGARQSSSERPRKACSTWPSSTSRMRTVSSWSPIGASSGRVQVQAAGAASAELFGELLAGDEAERGGGVAGQPLRAHRRPVPLGDAASLEDVDAGDLVGGGGAVHADVAPGSRLLGADLGGAADVAERGQVDRHRRLLDGAVGVEDDAGEPAARLDVVEGPAGRGQLEAGH